MVKYQKLDCKVFEPMSTVSFVIKVKTNKQKTLKGVSYCYRLYCFHYKYAVQTFYLVLNQFQKVIATLLMFLFLGPAH